jgi:hypothetical protein
MLRQTANSFTIGERGRAVFFKDDQGSVTMYLNWEGKDFLGRK